MLASPACGDVYSGPQLTDHSIDAAIASDDTRFVEWADHIGPTRTMFAPRGSDAIDPGGFNSLGDLDAGEIADGEQPGYLTVTFPRGIRNGTGVGVVIAAPEPATWAMLGLGLGGCLMRQQRRRRTGCNRQAL
jgi:hypothetical protein